MLALDWIFKTYPGPNSVAVMGWSAGALASPLYTHIVAPQYPGAQVTHFADGGGAYHLSEKLAPLFKSWGTENVLKRVEGFEDLPISGLTIEDLYIRAKVSNLRTYTSWGHDEAIIGGYYDAVLAKNALDQPRAPPYAGPVLHAADQRRAILDWFTAAVMGKPVEDVACVDCDTRECHWTRPRFP